MYPKMDYIHRRVLSIHFRLIESCLRDITSTLEANTNDRHFVLYSVRNNVDSESRMRIFKITALMLEELRKIKEEFMLETEEELTVRSDVLSNLNQIWAASKDLASGRLYDYERLSDHEKQLLNPHLVKLYSMLEYIYSQMK